MIYMKDKKENKKEHFSAPLIWTLSSNDYKSIEDYTKSKIKYKRLVAKQHFADGS